MSAEIIALIDLALTVVEKFGPKIGELAASGAITPEKQQEIKQRIAAIDTGEAFNKPNWKPDA